MPDRSPAQDNIRDHLGLGDAVSLIVGIVIGAGIYETAPLVFRCVGTPGAAMAVWLLGGLLSVIGALCYAELATTYPRQGGDYYFLRRAFGPRTAYLFSWSELTVVTSGSIGLMAFVFADYAVRLAGIAASLSPWFAAGAIGILSFANIFGLRSGQRYQNLLTVLKIIGLAAIVGAGFFWPREHPAAIPAPEDPVTSAGWGLAMILVLYTYGGWNDAAFIVAEMKNKRRNIPQALLLGTAGVAVTYLLINAAYLNGLGFAAARNSTAIAADVLEGPLGHWGAQGMAILVMISSLGALNGLILTRARIYAAAGADFATFRILGRWHPRWNTPATAILVQMGIAIAMVLLLGPGPGRNLVERGLAAFGMAAPAWAGHGGFDTLLKCTAPVFWFFLLLTGLSLFVLRTRDRDRERPFRVPLFPLIPGLFCATCAGMLISAIDFAGTLALFGAVPALAGLIVFFGCEGRTPAPPANPST